MSGGDVTAREARLAWVRQEDEQGCGPAVLAMLTGRSYIEARDLIDALWDEPKDWATDGASEVDLDRCLYADGFYIQRRYAAWRDKGTAARLAFPEPFAPLHYCMVKQPSHRFHFVVMLSDGTVLDPMREGTFSLSDWPEVVQVVGIASLAELEAAEAARAEAEEALREIEAKPYRAEEVIARLAASRKEQSE